MRVLPVYLAALCASTWVGERAACADVIQSGLLRSDTFLDVGGRTYSDFGYTFYPGEFEVETALYEHSFSRATGYARPLGDGAVFGVSSSLMTTYSLSRCGARSIVSSVLAVSEETPYELAGSLIALAESTGGTISLAVELQRWEDNSLVEILFHQTSWDYALGGSRLDLGIVHGGDIEGSLTGVLMPGQDYRLEATYTTDCSTSTEMFADGQIDLFVGAVPAPGTPALLIVILAGYSGRRRRSTHPMH